MVKIGVRILMALAALYLAAAAVLYLFQSSFIFPAPQTASAPAPGYEAVTLTTNDGMSLAAHWRAPLPGQPSVVHFHGNAGSLAGAAAENVAFAESGYGVLLVEYRGYGGNPGDPSEEGFKLDGRAAMDFLAAQSVPDVATIVKGHSIGAGTAMNIALDYRPAALILVAPFKSVPDLAARRAPIFPLDLMVRDRFDNLAKAPRLGVPTLVQHGGADASIPLAHGKAVADAMTDATFEPIAGAGHDMSGAVSVQERQIAWLAGLGL